MQTCFYIQSNRTIPSSVTQAQNGANTEGAASSSMPQSASTDGVSVDIYCFTTFIVLCSSPLHPKISMLILHTVLYTSPSC